MVQLKFYLPITNSFKSNLMTTISQFITIKIPTANPQLQFMSQSTMDTLRFLKLMFRLQFTQNKLTNMLQVNKISKVITSLSNSIKITHKLVHNINIKEVINQEQDLIMDNKLSLVSINIELKLIFS